jgi:hypothetical protein
MMETKIEVPSQVRELAVIGIDNAEKALALFFDNVAKSIAPNSAESVALIKAGYRGQDGLRPKDCSCQ